jgi:hypothetical protein
MDDAVLGEAVLGDAVLDGNAIGSGPAVLMTFVRIRGVTCVDLEGLASLG